MFKFPMLTQALALVGKQHDQRLVCRRFFIHCTQQAAQLLVFEGNFGVIQVARILLAKLGRRIIRLMRIVEMYPEKKRLLLPLHP